MERSRNRLLMDAVTAFKKVRDGLKGMFIPYYIKKNLKTCATNFVHTVDFLL